MPEINCMLRQLHLSHINESLSQRTREAIENKLAYPEFLALLLQDEILCRDNNKLIARIKRSGVRNDKTLESFDFNFNPKINHAQIQELASCRFINQKVPVLIMGPCGTGKSHLAQAIGHQAIRQGIDVILLTPNKLFVELQAARATNTFNKRFAALVKVPLLIIDEFGLKPFQPPQEEDLHDLIAERYERAATIVTSNLDFSEWGDAFTNRLLAAATLDRLRHGAYRLILEGRSYREGQLKQEENIKTK